MTEGPVGFVVALVLAGALVFANARVLARAGYAPYWGLLALIPPAYLVGIWIFAFIEWPAQRRRGKAGANSEEALPGEGPGAANSEDRGGGENTERR